MTASRATVAIAAMLLLLISASPGGGSESTALVHPPFGHCLGLHKVTSFHAFIYLGTRTRLDEPAGIAAVKLISKDDPSTGSDDDELTVFGLNSGRCEILYNTSLYNAEIYGECGGGRGQFRTPLGIAADVYGNVFVADTGNDRVVRLLYKDDALVHVRSFGSQGSGPRQFRKPSQIAIGHSGRLYVTDTGNDRVAILTSDGEPLGEIRGDPFAGTSLSAPTGLAVVERDDPWISRGQQFIVVSDMRGDRITKFTTDGRVLAVASADTIGPPRAQFGSLAIDYYGNIYATDARNGSIHKFDRHLRYLTAFGESGTGDGQFDEPRGITLWKRFGQIFITERSGAQYYWIGTEIRDLTATPRSFSPGAGDLTIDYFLTETSRVTIELLDEDGTLVHTLVSHRRRAVGRNSERWDGALGRLGDNVPPGDYTISVTAAPTYSSRQYFRDIAIAQVTIAPVAAD